jgi:hypothetical protein
MILVMLVKFVSMLTGSRHHLVLGHHQVVGHYVSLVLLPLLIVCAALLLVGPQQHHLSPVLVVARSFLRSMWRTMQRLRIHLLKMMTMS